MNRALLPWLPLALLLAFSACEGETSPAGPLPSADAAPPPTDAGSPASGPTWASDVAPIVFAQCVDCHREGAIAPFPLTTYAEAMPFAGAIASATAERRMPPTVIDASGSCQSYSNARWLTTEEIETLGAWAAAGAPEGDPSLVPTLPPPPPSLEPADLVLDPGEAYTPDPARTDDYRCFVVEPGLSEEAFVTGFEVVPGVPAEVHHLIVYAPEDDAGADEARAADAADPGPGYPCYGGTGARSVPVLVWVPGTGVTRMPSGTGVPLAPGRAVVVQIHYNTLAGVLPDRTLVRLDLAEDPVRAGRFTGIANPGLELEPRLELVESESSYPLGRSGSGPIVVWGVLPHMHTLGRTMRLEAIAGGETTCLGSVDRWDFHWQNTFWYAEPRAFDSIERVRIQCGYDTRDRTDVTRWGEGTEDEMCLAYVYTTAP